MFKNNDFGMTIKHLRKKKGLTQLELALELNISDTYLGKIERGENYPTVELAVSILNLFNINFSDCLFYGESKINREGSEKLLLSKILSVNDESDAAVHYFSNLTKLLLEKEYNQR